MDTQALLKAASTRKLRPGEISALAIYIQALERKAQDAQESLRLKSLGDQAPEHLSLYLDGQGRLAVQFPGAHAISLPSGSTTFERGAAMDLILSLLQARQKPQRGVGSPACPVQSDIPGLLALARGKSAKVLPPSHTRKASLEELDSLVSDLEL